MAKVYLIGSKRDGSYGSMGSNEDRFWKNYWDAKNYLDNELNGMDEEMKDLYWIKKFEFEGEIYNNKVYPLISRTQRDFRGGRPFITCVFNTKSKAEAASKDSNPSSKIGRFINYVIEGEEYYFETWEVV